MTVESDNRCCCLNKGILIPILYGMASSADRKLPSIGDLCSEMSMCFKLNKRLDPDVLLSFMKAKARREEVSTAPQLGATLWGCFLVHFSIVLKPSYHIPP